MSGDAWDALREARRRFNEAHARAMQGLMVRTEPDAYVTARDIQRMEAEGPESFQPFTPDGRAAVKRAEAILDARIVWVGQPSDSDPGDEQGGV